MPFKSKAQRDYLFQYHSDIAKRWASEYGTPKNLPEHVSGSSALKRHRKRRKK